MKKTLLIVAAIAALAGGAWTYEAQQGDFSLLDGQQKRWSDYQGQWLVVNFFAQWCAPCLEEVPELNRFDKAYGHRYALLGISYDPMDDEALKQLAEKHGIQFALQSAAHQVQLPMEKPQQLPATFLISPQGKVIKRLLGKQTARGLLAQIEALERG